MADKRMFSKKITNSDAFLDMPLSAQCLYFHLNMEADDDGFVNNPKMIMRNIRATQDDMNILIMKSFVLTFDSGIIVIKHWRINNWLRSDRKKDTAYPDEMNLLAIKDNGAYTFDQAKEKTSKNHKYGTYKHVVLSDEQKESLINEYGEALFEQCVQYLDDYLETSGKSYKNYYLVIKKWVIDAVKKNEQKYIDVQPVYIATKSEEPTEEEMQSFRERWKKDV